MDGGTQMKRALLLLLFALPLAAQFQMPAPPPDLTEQLRLYEASLPNWGATCLRYGNYLFAGLALITLASSFIWKALDSHNDIPGWGALMVRQLITLGAFSMLLVYGPWFMQTVINSYITVGQAASGVPAISPGDIMVDGIEIAGSFLIAGAAQGIGFGTGILTALVMVGCAGMILASFIYLVKGFIMAILQGYVAIYVAAIQLAWGGSPLTSVYAERYVAGAMNVGIKLMVFYFIVGVERAMAPHWIQQAAGIMSVWGALFYALSLACSVVIFCALANPEKLLSIVFGGVPDFTGHDLSAHRPFVGAAISAMTAGVGMAAGYMSGGMAMPLMAGGAAMAGGGSSASRAGGFAPVPPPPSPPRMIPPPRP